ncbi:36262_t:CDS:2, partial [Racocetra persica]
ALSVVSNMLAIAGALIALDAFLFGARPINPWGCIRTTFFSENIDHRKRIDGNWTIQHDELEVFLIPSIIFDPKLKFFWVLVPKL